MGETMENRTPNAPLPDGSTGNEKKRRTSKPAAAGKDAVPEGAEKKSSAAKSGPKQSARGKAADSQTAKSGKPQSVEQYVKERLENELSATEPSAPVDLNEIKKQFRRKRTQIPAYSNVQRYSPDVNTGLTDAQVNERFSQFLFNDTNQKYSKSYASILIGNLCTFFNLLCVLAAIALAYSQAPVSQFLFVVIFALNLGFGIVTEIIAKRKIDKLSLLTCLLYTSDAADEL